MRLGRLACAAALAIATACGGHDAPPPPPAAPGDAGAPRADAAPAELPPLVLGMASLDGYAWRKRAGHTAFHAARKAEDRDDWPRVVDACHEALAADPGHLEAAWLLAVGLGTLGRPASEILPPLAVAVSGDFGKWGPASLEQPALAAFLTTETGAAWRRRIALDQPRYAEALARAIVVTAGAELYAYDPDQPRWYRITRTYGAVIGGLAVPDAHYIYYVTSRAHRLQAGVIDLSRGHSSRPQELGTAGPFQIARTTSGGGAWIGASSGARMLDDADGFLHGLPAKSARPPGPWLEAMGKSTRVHRLPIADVTADWDDRGLASSIRLAKSNRVVTVPTGQIDGDTVAWAPDGAHLAFVAVLDEHCTPGAPTAAAFVVDAATGTLQELERAIGGLSIAWVGDRRITVAGDHGVSIDDLGGAPPVALTGAVDLLVRKRHPHCAPDGSDTPDEPAEPDDPAEPEGSGSGSGSAG